MVHGENRIPYWIDRSLTGLAGPDDDATISFGLPFELGDCPYGKSRIKGDSSSDMRVEVTPTPQPYPAYKPSNVEWLGNVPAHWDVRRLKKHLLINDSGVWGDEFDEQGVIVLRSTEQTIDGGGR